MSAAEVIRARYVEVLAESLWSQWAKGRGIDGYIWADVEDAMRTDFLDNAEVHADALATAGLLPIGQEITTAFPDEPTADDEAMVRYVTEWQEAAGRTPPSGTRKAPMSERDMGSW